MSGGSGGTRLARKHSLALLITLPFLVLFLVFTSALLLIGITSFQASATNEGRERIAELSAEMETYLESFFEQPLRLVQALGEEISLGATDLGDKEVVTIHLAAQLRHSPWVSFLSVALPDGRFLGAARPPDGSVLSVFEAGWGGDRSLQRRFLGDDDRPGGLIARGAPYDPRQRPWFTAGLLSTDTIWYPAYRYASLDGLGLGVALAVHDKQGQLSAILSGDIGLERISTFLRGVLPQWIGTTYLVDRDGLLLASSSRAPIYRPGAGDFERIPLAQSSDPLLGAAGRLIAASGPGTEPLHLRFKGPAPRTDISDDENGNYLVMQKAASVASGLEVGIGVILPDGLLEETIKRNIRLSLALILFTTLLAALMGVYVSREIARPALSIHDRARRLALGDWSGGPATPGQARELVALAEAFETMADSLHATLEGLEEKVAKRTASLEILVREVLHRSKNNFTIAASMLSLQASSSTSPEASQALEEARGRIISMALLYDRLYRAPEFGDADCASYLGSVIEDLRGTLIGERAIVLEADIEELSLDPKRAATLGIIVTELVTNACKYAFPATGGGRIRISVRGTEGRLSLRVADDGRGFPPGFDPSRDGGFGFTLVESLALQCRGSLAVSTSGGGIVDLVLDIISTTHSAPVPALEDRDEGLGSWEDAGSQS